VPSQADQLHFDAQTRLVSNVGDAAASMLAQITLERSRLVRDAFATTMARLVAGGQYAAANLASTYIRALEPPVEPVDLAGALRDRLLTPQDPKAFVGLLRFWRLQDEGAEIPEAREMAGTYARGLAEGDVLAGQRAGLEATANATRRVTRYRKMARPGACAWCQAVAAGDDQAAARYFTPDRVPRHEFCKCGYAATFVEEYLTRKGWRLAPAGVAPAPTPTGFVATGDWAKDREAIKALQTDDWFTKRTLAAAPPRAQSVERLDQLRAIGKAIDDEARRRLGPRPFGTAPWDWERQMGAKRLEVLSELRSMGGEIKFSNARTTAAMRDIRAAARFFPSDWFDAMAGQWQAKQVKRGFFSSGSRIIALSGTGQKRLNVAIHEVGHGMQKNLRVGNAEQQFHMARNTHINGVLEQPVKLWDPDDPNAKTRGDKYQLPYTGREYTWGTLEVLTTTAESVFGTSGYADQDMTNWLLGTMAKL